MYKDIYYIMFLNIYIYIISYLVRHIFFQHIFAEVHSTKMLFQPTFPGQIRCKSMTFPSHRPFASAHASLVELGQRGHSWSSMRRT